MSAAIITGGASGIGRAIAAALVARGDHVVVADLDGPGAKRAAEELEAVGAGTAEGAALDVTDADAVHELYTAVARERGRLDLVVNNAGIATAGAFDELTLDHWNRTLDVNLRGVIHGVHAAYPLMIEQGGGQILNTASLAGLTPSVLMGPYTASKHAVVALTMALRAEAAGRGVRVSALCPGFVDTPLLDSTNPGLPQTQAGQNTRRFAHRLQPRFYTADALAQDVLRGLERNRALIVAPRTARATWRLTRLAPAVPLLAGRMQMWSYRRRS